MFWDASQGPSLQGQFAWALPQGSEERGIFVRLIAKQVDYFITCLFLAHKKYKNLQFTESFKTLALDSMGEKSDFEKQSSFSTGTLTPVNTMNNGTLTPVNTMNNETLTRNLQMKSRTQDSSASMIPKSLTTAKTWWLQPLHIQPQTYQNNCFIWRGLLTLWILLLLVTRGLVLFQSWNNYFYTAKLVGELQHEFKMYIGSHITSWEVFIV